MLLLATKAIPMKKSAETFMEKFDYEKPKNLKLALTWGGEK